MRYDYTDRTTCIIFGDAAGAVLLEPNHDGYGILDSILRSDGSGRQYLYMKAGGSQRPPSDETVSNKNILFTRMDSRFLNLQ